MYYKTYQLEVNYTLHINYVQRLPAMINDKYHLNCKKINIVSINNLFKIYVIFCFY